MLFLDSRPCVQLGWDLLRSQWLSGHLMGAGKEQSQIPVLPTSTVLFLPSGVLVVHLLWRPWIPWDRHQQQMNPLSVVG